MDGCAQFKVQGRMGTPRLHGAGFFSTNQPNVSAGLHPLVQPVQAAHDLPGVGCMHIETFSDIRASQPLAKIAFGNLGD